MRKERFATKSRGHQGGKIFWPSRPSALRGMKWVTNFSPSFWRILQR